MTDLFWQEIKNAVHQVTTHRDRQITIERGGHKAAVVAAGDAILISLEEVDPEPVVLISPGT